MKNSILALLIIGTILGVYQYTLPAWTHIQGVRAEINQLGGIIAEAESITEARDKLLERYNSVTEEQRALLDALVPAKLSQEDLYVFFQKIVEGAGVPLANIALSEGNPDKGGQKTIVFEVQTLGTYEDLRRLIDALENSTRIMDIDSVSLSPDDTGAFTVGLKGKMYYGN